MSKFTATLEQVIRSEAHLIMDNKEIHQVQLVDGQYRFIYIDDDYMLRNVLLTLEPLFQLEFNENGEAEVRKPNTDLHSLKACFTRPFTKADVPPSETAPAAIKSPRLTPDGKTIVCSLSAALAAAQTRVLDGYEIAAVMVHPAPEGEPPTVELEVKTSNPSVVKTRVFDDREIRINEHGKAWLQIADEDGSVNRLEFRFYIGDPQLRPIGLSDFDPPSEETAMREVFTTPLAPRAVSEQPKFTCNLLDALFTADRTHLNTYEVDNVDDGHETAIHLSLVNNEELTVQNREIEVDADGYAEFTEGERRYRFRFQSFQPMQQSEVLNYRKASPVENTATATPVEGSQQAAFKPAAGSFNRGAATQLGGVAAPPHLAGLHKLPLNLPDSLDLK